MFRISTAMFYNQNTTRMNDLQARLLKTTEHMSSGKRILTPQDDPVGAARALDIRQGKAMNTQFKENRAYARESLNLEEGTLTSVTSRIQSVQTLLVAAGDGAYSEDELRAISTEIKSMRDEMLGYANTRNSYGDYIFSGYQAKTQPFVQDPLGNVSYNGDNGQRFLRVDSARTIPVNDSGANVFTNIRGETPAKLTSTTNQLTASVAIKDQANWEAMQRTNPGNYYDVQFSGSSPNVSYTITHRDAGGTAISMTDPVTGNPVTSITGTYTGRENEPLVITQGGVEIVINGWLPDDPTQSQPQAQSMSITPGDPVSQDVFAILNEAIALLDSPLDGTPAAKTNLSLGLAASMNKMASALDRTLNVRGLTGSRLKELDALDTSGEDKNLQYTDAISKLEDLDYYTAISELMQNQTMLEAAQKVFLQTTNLSLFNIM
ncbi:MAG: flagellar hook-associated protein FlgL [Burkholderiaceae bacterium]|jgi:flagellar hook-associated protein 3 FlgL|nr:flagellar hook-associated protein FlgL [Burkholderiaceae bacterium]